MRRVLIATLTVILISAAGAYGMFIRDLSAARARVVGRSTAVGTTLGQIEYASIGHGTPILIIHGAAGGFDQSLDMIGALAAKGYEQIAPSRFGYLGSSSPSQLTVEAQADAYVELLDHLGVAKVDVVSISAGAWSALQLAIRHPDRVHALLLLVPADYLPVGTSIHGGVIARQMFESDFFAWAMLMLMPIVPGGLDRIMLGTDPEVVRAAGSTERARVQKILTHLLPVEPRRLGTNFDVVTAGTHAPETLGAIRCPVLAISASDDRFGTAIRAKYIAAQVPNAKAIIYPTGGHALVGRYAEALRDGDAFLRSVQDSPPTLSGSPSTSAGGDAPRAPVDISAGQAIVEQVCSHCHKFQGRRFTDQSAANLEVTLKGIVAGTVKHRRRLFLSDTDIKKITAYLSIKNGQ